MKRDVIRKPPGMSRDEWIDVLCARYPEKVMMIRVESEDYANRRKTPVIHQVYCEKDDYVFGEQPPYIEYVLDHEDLRWEE